MPPGRRRRRRRCSWPIAGLLISAGLCLAWADSWEELRAAAGQVTSIQARFEQRKHLPILVKPLVSKGLFYYTSANDLRWEYQSPIASILIMHGGKVQRWIKDPRTENFKPESGAGLDAMQFVFAEISQWLAGRFDDNPLFEAVLVAGPKIVLTPKQASFEAVLERIELELDSRPGIIRRVLIFEGVDTYTEIVFSDAVLNQTIDPAVFRNVP